MSVSAFGQLLLWLFTVDAAIAGLVLVVVLATVIRKYRSTK